MWLLIMVYRVEGTILGYKIAFRFILNLGSKPRDMINTREHNYFFNVVLV